MWYVLRFMKEHDEREQRLAGNYQINWAGGVHFNKQLVGITHGDSIKFLLVEIFDRLKPIQHTIADG